MRACAFHQEGAGLVTKTRRAVHRVIPHLKRVIEKKWTPALTVPQVRFLLAGLLTAHLDRSHPGRIRRTMGRRLQRNQEARFYHWKCRNRLPPRRFNQRR